jgi:hypothetical protein
MCFLFIEDEKVGVSQTNGWQNSVLVAEQHLRHNIAAPIQSGDCPASGLFYLSGASWLWFTSGAWRLGTKGWKRAVLLLDELRRDETDTGTVSSFYRQRPP